eukprot:SAG31_NODE_6070_length_2184_cov_2.288729_1_plen_199_part_00
MPLVVPVGVLAPPLDRRNLLQMGDGFVPPGLQKGRISTSFYGRSAIQTAPTPSRPRLRRRLQNHSDSDTGGAPSGQVGGFTKTYPCRVSLSIVETLSSSPPTFRGYLWCSTCGNYTIMTFHIYYTDCSYHYRKYNPQKAPDTVPARAGAGTAVIRSSARAPCVHVPGGRVCICENFRVACRLNSAGTYMKLLYRMYEN